MEYTKDIVLEISKKRQLGYDKIKDWTSNLKKIVESNKIITFTLGLLITLIVIDLVLVNYFLELLGRIY